MCSNRLQLNALDGVHLVRSCAPSSSHSWSRRPSRARLCSSGPVSLVCTSMTMRAHINHVLSSCYGTLRQLRSINRSLPSHALNTLVTSLVHSRLDYCNVVFGGLPACDVQRLQSVLNTAVRLVTGSSRRDHVTSLLRDRHWLLLSSASNTSCVRLFIVVCTATHHPTWSSSRLLLQVPELVWDLLSRWPSQCHARSHHLETALLWPPVCVRGTSYRHTYV